VRVEELVQEIAHIRDLHAQGVAGRAEILVVLDRLVEVHILCDGLVDVI